MSAEIDGLLLDAEHVAALPPFPQYPNVPNPPWGPHVEHRQMDCLLAVSHGDASGITQEMINPRNKTTNQEFCCLPIHLGGARIRPRDFDREYATNQALDFFKRMEKNGHQALGPKYGNEQGAPDPHDQIFARAAWSLLRESDLMAGGDTVKQKVLDYLANHHAMCSAFWTPKGVRVAGARAKHFAGQELRPNWTLDSRIYVEVNGDPGALPKEPCDWDTVKIARAEREFWPEIVKRSRRAATKLVIPVLRWAMPGGGWAACLDHDVAMNDRLSWIVTDAVGTIVGAGENASEWVRPDRAPDLVFGG